MCPLVVFNLFAKGALKLAQAIGPDRERRDANRQKHEVSFEQCVAQFLDVLHCVLDIAQTSVHDLLCRACGDEVQLEEVVWMTRPVR